MDTGLADKRAGLPTEDPFPWWCMACQVEVRFRPESLGVLVPWPFRYRLAPRRRMTAAYRSFGSPSTGHCQYSASHPPTQRIGPPMGYISQVTADGYRTNMFGSFFVTITILSKTTAGMTRDPAALRQSQRPDHDLRATFADSEAPSELSCGLHRGRHSLRLPLAF